MYRKEENEEKFWSSKYSMATDSIYLIFISGGTLAREENEAGYPVIPKKSRTLKLSRDSQRARIMASDGESWHTIQMILQCFSSSHIIFKVCNIFKYC